MTQEAMQGFTDSITSLTNHAHSIRQAWIDADDAPLNTLDQIIELLESLQHELMFKA